MTFGVTLRVPLDHPFGTLGSKPGLEITIRCDLLHIIFTAIIDYILVHSRPILWYTLTPWVAHEKLGFLIIFLFKLLLYRYKGYMYVVMIKTLQMICILWYDARVLWPTKIFLKVILHHWTSDSKQIRIRSFQRGTVHLIRSMSCKVTASQTLRMIQLSST